MALRGNKVGDIYYEAHVYGDDLRKDARKLGNRTGNEFGDEFSESAEKRLKSRFSKLGNELLPGLRRDGRVSAHGFTDAFENVLVSRIRGMQAEIAEVFADKDGLNDFAKRFETVDEAADHLRRRMRELNAEGALNDQMWNRLGGTLNRWLGNARVAEREANELRESLKEMHTEVDKTETHVDRAVPALEKFRTEIIKTTKASDDHERSIHRVNRGWSSIPHNGRQAILIVGAIAAGFEQIATLGSAAGAGVVTLGTSLVALLPGLGVAIGGIASLVKTMSDENAAQPEYTKNIRALGKAFVDLGKSIEENLFSRTDDALGRFLNNTLPRLTPAINRVASSLGDSLGNAIDRLGGNRAIDQFNKVLHITEGISDDILQTFVNLISAIAGVTIAAGPTIERFGGWLKDITKQFDDWANSPVGQGQLREWFDNGTRVLSKFNNLLVEAGKMLGRLVTPESVKRTERFLDALAGSMDFLEGIGRALGKLDIFGLAATLLDTVGSGLSGFLRLLEPVAQFINISLNRSFEVLGATLQWLTPLFIPLQVAWDLLVHAFERITEWSQPIVDAFASLDGSMGGLGNTITEQLKTPLDQLIDGFLDLLPPPEEIAAFIKDELIPRLQEFARWLTEEGVPAIIKFWQWLDMYVIPAFAAFFTWVGRINSIIQVMTDIFNLAVTPALAAFRAIWDTLTAPIQRFVGTALGLLQPLIDILNKVLALMGSIMGYTPKVRSAVQSASSATVTPRTAVGGTFYTPQVREIAEAGAEMVVPLQRPLSQVDPSVRAVAAFARGLTPPTASGKSVVIESGAFQVITPTQNPVLLASMVMDEVVEVALN